MIIFSLQFLHWRGYMNTEDDIMNMETSFP